ncbi:unnamed protein product [Haemonchus placei]|uniref:Alpha-amylase n=1 Tax=Haemonchus placei TaxID=6290 RepID=A0A0N4VTR7_HAEPC|nr:unnamed protein product [Haemonchus placei]
MLAYEPVNHDVMQYTFLNRGESEESGFGTSSWRGDHVILSENNWNGENKRDCSRSGCVAALAPEHVIPFHEQAKDYSSKE